MEVWGILAQISLLINFEPCLAGVCQLIPCIREPKTLRFWYHEMEIDASSINVHEGDDVSITCDGSCVGTNYNPYLRWYGPDRYWIASQDQNDRIYVEQDWSNKYQKLHIRSAQQSDAGPYYCRGKLGEKTGWKLKSIIIYVVPKTRHRDNHSFRSNHYHRSRTSTRSPRISARTRVSPRRRTSFLSTSEPNNYPTTVSWSETHHTTTKSLLSSTAYSESETTTVSDVTTEGATSSVGGPEGTTTVYTGTTGATSNCSSFEFLCQNGDCISNDLRCDSVPDCYHGDDEENCEKFFQSCSESEIACDNNIGCFSKIQTCDGHPDCQDGSDEFLFRCERTSDHTDVTFG